MRKGTLYLESEVEKFAGIDEFEANLESGSDKTWDSGITHQWAADNGFQCIVISEETNEEGGDRYFFKEDSA